MATRISPIFLLKPTKPGKKGALRKVLMQKVLIRIALIVNVISESIIAYMNSLLNDQSWRAAKAQGRRLTYTYKNTA